MKANPLNVLRLASAGVVGLALGQSGQAATVLTGDNSAGQGHNVNLVNTAHGSFSTGTPNIALQWVGDWQPYNSRTSSAYTPFATWPGDAGADRVYQMDGPAGNVHSIIFTPDSGFSTVLLGLDLNDWVQGPSGLAGYNVGWTVTGSVSGALGSGTFVTVDGANTSYTFGTGGIVGGLGEALTLSLTQQNGSGSYLAMDNLAFDQIPEVSSVALGVVGLGALAMRRRRK